MSRRPGWPGPNRPARPFTWALVALVCLAFVAAMGIVASEYDLRGPDEDSSEYQKDVLPVAYWQEQFDNDADEFRERCEKESRSGDSWDYYGLAYCIDAYTAMFEATGEARYLDTSLELIDNMVADARPAKTFADSRFQDSYLGWTSEREDTEGEQVPLFESYNWRYVTRTLRVMRDTPAIYDDPDYRARYDRLLAFTEVHIFEKWFTRGADEHIYRNRTHMAAHWAFIAADLFGLTTNDTARERYREVVENINTDLPNSDSSLREQLELVDEDPPTYFWSDVWGKTSTPGQDVSHGNGEVAYIVEAHDLDWYWTDEDILALSNTLTRAVLKDGGEFAEYVDGSGDGEGALADGFVKLGRYGARTQVELQEHDVQNEHYRANMALNAQRLGQT